jgi:hypothetical protein
MGWLTSRRERLVLSSVDNSAPAADAIKDFAEMRGLSMSDAQVKEWQYNIAPPAAAPEPVLPEVISLPESAQAEILEQIRKEVQP